MDQSKNTGFQAGKATGQAEEKSNQLLTQAGNAAQSAKESCLEAGKQVQAAAVGAADTVKNSLGMKK